jgi:hypothetical protein
MAEPPPSPLCRWHAGAAGQRTWPLQGLPQPLRLTGGAWEGQENLNALVFIHVFGERLVQWVAKCSNFWAEPGRFSSDKLHCAEQCQNQDGMGQ